MEQLSGQDASFLYFETPKTPMHIGSIMIYDQSTAPGGKQSFKDILRAIERRLHLAKSFRQKVANVPFNLDHPYWIEDRDFDLEFHVRHIRLPEPGDWRQLCIQTARLHSRILDLTKPLWEFTVIEGLDGIPGLPKGSYAIVQKVHHACIDGMSGVDLVEAIHDIEPEPQEQPSSRPWTGENDPNPFELMFRAQVNNFTQPLRFAQVMARTVPAMGRLGQSMLERRFDGMNLQPPRTRFNRSVSAHRVVEGRSFDLKEVRAIKGAVEGATVNDVVLTVVGGALRGYLDAKHELPESSMIAMAPISVRSEDEKGALGNRVAAMNVPLGTDVGHPLERLKVVHDRAAQSKAMTQAVGAKLMTDYSQFIPSTTAALASRLYTEYGVADQVNLPFNCVVTNVPGPQIPIYFGGARLVTHYGLGPIYDGMGVIFPVYSYCGRIQISVISCREMIPDPEFFAECLEASYDALKAAALPDSGEQASQPDDKPVAVEKA